MPGAGAVGPCFVGRHLSQGGGWAGFGLNFHTPAYRCAKGVAVITLFRSRIPLLFPATAFIALLLAGCSGDDGASISGPGGSDEQYVKDLCSAAGRFADDLDKAFSGPTPSSVADAFSLFLNSLGKPYEAFAVSFEKAAPPADLKEWHAKTAKDLAAAVKAVKEKKFESETLIGSPIPAIPDGPRQRLQKIAGAASECEKANLFEAGR